MNVAPPALLALFAAAPALQAQAGVEDFSAGEPAARGACDGDRWPEDLLNRILWDAIRESEAPIPCGQLPFTMTIREPSR